MCHFGLNSLPSLPAEWGCYRNNMSLDISFDFSGSFYVVFYSCTLALCAHCERKGGEWGLWVRLVLKHEEFVYFSMQLVGDVTLLSKLKVI